MDAGRRPVADVRRRRGARVIFWAALAGVGTVATLAAALSGLAFSLPAPAAPSLPVRGPAASLRVRGQVARQAEGEPGEQGVVVVEEGSVAEAELPAEDVAVPPALPPDQPLFQELYVTNRSQPKAMMRAVVGAFNNGARAVDLVLTASQCKSTLMYTLPLIPRNFRSSAMILTRRRDRRLRLRVVQNFQPMSDDNPEVFKVSRSSNYTAMGQAIKNQIVDVGGNNKMRTVKLVFAGKEAASNALLTVETASREAYRELFFEAEYIEEERPAPEGEDAPPTKQVSIVATVTAA